MRVVHLAFLTFISIVTSCKTNNSDLSEVKDSRTIEKSWLDDSVSKIENLKQKSSELVGAAISAQSDYSQAAATAIRTQTDALVQMTAELELYLRSQVTGPGQTIYVPVETEIQGGRQIIGLRPILNDVKRIRANIARDLESNLGKIAATNNTIRNSGLGVFISASSALTTDLTKLEVDIRTWYFADGSGGGGTVNNCDSLPGFLRAGNNCWRQVSDSESDCNYFCRNLNQGQGQIVGGQISSSQSELQTICRSLLSTTRPPNFLRYDSASSGLPLTCYWQDRSSNSNNTKFCPCERPTNPQQFRCSACSLDGNGPSWTYDIVYNNQTIERVYSNLQLQLGWAVKSNCENMRNSDARCRGN